MSLRRDRRGAALQVGAVLLLGFLVISLSLYQATVVPEQNRRVEFRHSQQVQTDMVEVRNALQRAGTSEDVQSVSVRMGTTYPARVFFVNPAPPSGAIRTGTEQSVTLSNVSATGEETADFLNTGANGRYELATENLSYRPGYNVYRSAPTTTYQSGVLVNEFAGANDTAVTDQALIRGDEIYLVAVRGNLSLAQTRTRAVDPESLSTATTATTVTNESGRINVTVPTTLTEERWETLLADEDRVRGVTKRGGRVSILLADGTYRLRTALVGVGTGAEAPGPAYLTRVDPRGGADVAVEVRDRFNNPVPNSRVDGNLTVNVTAGTDVLAPDSVEVGADGRATFRYAGETGTANLTLFEDGSAALDTADNGNGSVEVAVTDADIGGAGGDGAGGEQAGRQRVVLEDVSAPLDDRVTLRVTNAGNRTANFTGYRLDYATQLNANGRFVDGPDEIVTVEFNGTTVTGTAAEYRSPYFFSDAESAAVDPLSPGETYDTTITLDRDIVPSGSQKGALLSLAYYIEGVGTVRFTITFPL